MIRATTTSMRNPVRFRFMMFMLCLMLQVVHGEEQVRCLPKEREALLQFKAAIVDDYGMLSSWTTPHCCQWKGIRCSNLTAHILSLDLHGEIVDLHLSGEIHKSLMELRQLQYLNLSYNSFEDSHIPEFIGSFKNLKYLDLFSCRFSGKIPSQLGSLSHLKYLNLAGNSLEGSIPRQLGNLSQLQELYLGNNPFEGNVPSQLGNLFQLQVLSLGDSSFEGNVPSQLGNLSHLQELYIIGNHALKLDDGGQWLSNLISLTHLYLDSVSNLNRSHTWPHVIGKLPKLRELGLIDCSLSYYFILSSRPFKFNSSTSLSFLDLSFNTFTSPMIFEWVSNTTSSLVELHLISSLQEGSTSGHFGMAMNSLRYLDLRSNTLKGRDLKSFTNICTLYSLNLYMNNLTEDLPSILDHLSSGCVRYSLRELDLSNNHITGNLPELSVFSSLKALFLDQNHLSGEIPQDIILPPKLESLSIQLNSIEGRIPKSFGNACALCLLDMSSNSLSEEFSVIIHHLSGCARNSLQELSLQGNKINGTFPDLSIFLALKKLDLTENQLSGKIYEGSKLPPSLEYLSIQLNKFEGGIPKSFGNACALCLLDMSSNSLSEEFSVIIHHLSGCARNSLQELSLQGNKINGTFPDLSIFLALKKLDLTENQLSGKIYEGSKLPPSLEYLSIQLNKFEGGIPKSFGNACALRSLDMSQNSFSEEFPRIIHHLSGCARYSLEELDINSNQINGTLPDFSIFTSLKGLSLYINKLNGEIPKNIQFPPQLEKLHMYSNYLRGVLTDYNFANVSRLRELDLSDNSLALEFTQNWVPPFQLFFIKLRSCKLGPTFPKWLKTQNKFYYIDISNASISDVVPEWFWGKLSLQGMTIDISYNKLRGIIPNIPQKFLIDEMSLRSNQFEGPIPLFLRNSRILDLSKNEFSDSTLFLCLNGTIETLYQLDISNNQLSGQIPDCWSHFKSLIYLDLSYNNFSGKIPTSMGSLFNLQALLLRNNNLISEIPLSLRSCTELVMLDMAENKLSGLFPAWIGSNYKNLQFLSLGSNNFYGTLPMQICYLKNIQLLDLSINNLFGKIPKCIKNFVVMADNMSSYEYHGYSFRTWESGGIKSYELNGNLMWKGSKQMFMNDELSLLKGIDLSSNHFSEEIPMEIEDLFGLILLNLSRNNLIGKIPSNIGKLASLEFLDLSRNQLVGPIPISLTQIDRLTMLDLSHNYLSGKIPISTQLQSFSTSSYEDNLDLCGLPLEKLCINEEQTQNPNVKGHDDEYSFFNNDFFISMSFGFIISFWMVFGSILLKRSWRHVYFKFLISLADNINDKVNVFTMIFKVDTGN